jgi:hypothetical protein
MAAKAAAQAGPAPSMQDLYTAMGQFGQMLKKDTTPQDVRFAPPVVTGGLGHANPYLARALAPPDVAQSHAGQLGQYLGKGG